MLLYEMYVLQLMLWLHLSCHWSLMCLIHQTSLAWRVRGNALVLLPLVFRVKKPVPWNSIIFWIRVAINHTYGYASEEDCRLVRVKAHKVRKIAISLLFWRNCAVQLFLEHLLSPLPLRCYPQAYAYLYHQLCGGCSRGHVACLHFQLQCSN